MIHDIQHVQPASEAHWLSMRRDNINSSEIAALWGWNPFLSAFSLWGIKAGVLDEPIVEGERIDIGRYLEPGIAALAANKFGFSSVPMKHYSFSPSLRIGASYDFKITEWKGNPVPCIQECKSVAWDAWGGMNRKWNADDPDDILAPRYVEIQCQVQMLMSGIEDCVITPFVAGEEVHLLRRKANKQVHEKILAKVAAFWASIDAWRKDGCPPTWEAYAPAPNWSSDAEAVLNAFKRPNPFVSIDPARMAALEPLVEQFVKVRDARLSSDKEEKSLKAQVVAACGGIVTDGILPNGFKVSWSPSKAGAWTLRVSPPKESV